MAVKKSALLCLLDLNAWSWENFRRVARVWTVWHPVLSMTSSVPATVQSNSPPELSLAEIEISLFQYRRTCPGEISQGLQGNGLVSGRRFTA
jgi:hypothetical protein